MVLSDFWGELRLWRICLIHKRGIADDKAAQETKIFKWFQEGEVVQIDPPKVEQIITEFFKFLYGELQEYEAKLKQS